MSKSQLNAIASQLINSSRFSFDMPNVIASKPTEVKPGFGLALERERATDPAFFAAREREMIFAHS